MHTIQSQSTEWRNSCEPVAALVVSRSQSMGDHFWPSAYPGIIVGLMYGFATGGIKTAVRVITREGIIAIS